MKSLILKMKLCCGKLKVRLSCMQYKYVSKTIAGSVTIPRYISTLGLRPSDIKHLQSGQMLEDTHMMAAQILIQLQFPQLQGCHAVNTSLSKYVPVNGSGKFEMLACTYGLITYMCPHVCAYLASS